MPSTATPGTHQVTLNLTGLGNVVRAYTSNLVGLDGWSMPAGGTVSATADGLLVNCTSGATNYITKTVATVAGKARRVRARVRLQDPEGRPALVGITDNLAMTDYQPRLVSGVPVWIEGSHVTDTVTGVRIQVATPTGSSAVAIIVEAITFDTEDLGASQWWVSRQDRNGTVELVGGQPVATEVDGLAATGGLQFGSRRGGATGALTFVDREAPLSGTVTYTVTDAAGGTTVLVAGPTSTGYGVLHRVADAASTMHQVTVIDYRGGRAAQAQPIPVLGAALPNIPLAPLAATAGTLVAYFDTLDAAMTVADDLATGDVFLLRQPVTSRTSMDTYLVAQSLDVGQELTDLEAPKWGLTVTYLETARPLTP